MFTVKFMNFYDDGTSAENCVKCNHYEARSLMTGGWVIAVYPTYTMADGVEWRVAEVDHTQDAPVFFDVCYIENEEGKTVGHYSSRKGVKR